MLLSLYLVGATAHSADAQAPPTHAQAVPATNALRLTSPAASQGRDELAPARGSSLPFMVGSSLALVLGLFLLAAWVFRRHAPSGSMILPREVVEVLGRTSLPGRQQMCLVRCGEKLLLVNVTPGGATTLTEIDDPVEVERLLALCQARVPSKLHDGGRTWRAA